MNKNKKSIMYGAHTKQTLSLHTLHSHPPVCGRPLHEVQAAGGGGDDMLGEIPRRDDSHAVVQLESGTRLRPVVLSESANQRGPQVVTREGTRLR